MEYKLKDLIDISHGYAFKGKEFSESSTNDIILTPGNVKVGGGLKLEKLKYLKENIDFNTSYIFNENDIFVTMTDLSKAGDTLGYPASIHKVDNVRFLHNQRLGRIIIKDDNKIDKNYLFYLMCNHPYRNYILSTSTGSTVKHTSPKTILNFKVDLPTLSEQKTIGKTLKLFDESINNNNKIIANLEEFSQSVFKRWFIDFEFPDENGNLYKSNGGLFDRSELGDIPKTWSIDKLVNKLDLIIDHRGKTPKKLGGDWESTGIPALSAKNIKNKKIVNRDKIKFVNSTLYDKWMKIKLRKGDILLTSEAPLGETFYIAENTDIVLSQRLFGLRAEPSMTSEYLWEYVNSAIFQNELIKRSSGSTVVGIRQKELLNIPIITPCKDSIMKFKNKISPILSLADTLQKENIELESLKNILLPKLMAGEIELPDELEVDEHAELL